MMRPTRSLLLVAFPSLACDVGLILSGLFFCLLVIILAVCSNRFINQTFFSSCCSSVLSTSTYPLEVILESHSSCLLAVGLKGLWYYEVGFIPSGLKMNSHGQQSFFLESIPEIDDDLAAATANLALGEGLGKGGKDQEYFVPWHLPYHRADIGRASKCALESGLAKSDDKKRAVVYNRCYHVFEEGELERLVSDMGNVVVVDRFFDKSNWRIILEKTC